MEALFPEGNLDSWIVAIQQYLPQAIATITGKIVPLVEGALVALLGEGTAFSRESATVQSTGQSIQGLLQYSTAAFRVKDVAQEAVANDEAYINSTITTLPGVKFFPSKIDTEKGTVQVQFILPIGYQQQ